MLLAQLETAALDLSVVRMVIEEQVLELLHLLVQRLHLGEMAVY